MVEKSELLQSAVPAVTREGYGYDPQRGELWFAGETAEAVLLELEARRSALATEAKSLAEGTRTPLGRTYDDGVELSGGQWQKLALGRAMMRTAPLVLA